MTKATLAAEYFCIRVQLGLSLWEDNGFLFPTDPVWLPASLTLT